MYIGVLLSEIGKLVEKGLIGRRRQRWENIIKRDIEEMGCKVKAFSSG